MLLRPGRKGQSLPGQQEGALPLCSLAYCEQMLQRQMQQRARLAAPGEASRLPAAGKGLLWPAWATGEKEKLVWEGASPFFRPK